MSGSTTDRRSAAPSIDRSPARLSAAVALGVALSGALSLSVSVPAFALYAHGALVLAAGLYGGSRAVVTLGATGEFAGVCLAGLAGAPPPLLVFATAAVVVSWDVAEFAVGLGAEMGRAAATRRAELLHAGASILLGLSAAAGGSLVFTVAGAGSTLVPVALLCGAVVLVVALRP